MPLRYERTEGRNAGLFLALLDVGASTAPTPVTITVDTGGAQAGDTEIPITDPGTNIPKNTVLTFDDINATRVVVVEEFTAGAAGNLIVETYEGFQGDGVANDLAAGDAASWDQLFTVAGVQNAQYAMNEQTQDTAPAAYGDGSGVTITPSIATSASPSFQVSGSFVAEGQLTKDLLLHNGGNRNWWFRYVAPKPDGTDFERREGLSRIRGLTRDAPADGFLELNYTVRITSEQTVTFPAGS